MAQQDLFTKDFNLQQVAKQYIDTTANFITNLFNSLTNEEKYQFAINIKEKNKNITDEDLQQLQNIIIKINELKEEAIVCITPVIEKYRILGSTVDHSISTFESIFDDIKKQILTKANSPNADMEIKKTPELPNKYQLVNMKTNKIEFDVIVKNNNILAHECICLFTQLIQGVLFYLHMETQPNTENLSQEIGLEMSNQFSSNFDLRMEVIDLSINQTKNTNSLTEVYINSYIQFLTNLFKIMTHSEKTELIKILNTSYKLETNNRLQLDNFIVRLKNEKSEAIKFITDILNKYPSIHKQISNSDLTPVSGDVLEGAKNSFFEDLTYLDSKPFPKSYKLININTNEIYFNENTENTDNFLVHINIFYLSGYMGASLLSNLVTPDMTAEECDNIFSNNYNILIE